MLLHGDGHPFRLVLLLLGSRRVKDVPLASASAGWHAVAIDGALAGGRRIGAGVYLCRIESAEGTETRRLVIL